MDIKLPILAVLTSTILIAATSPLSVGSRSIDTGGTKPALDAYSDGAGVLVINQSADTQIDNSSMNKLVFKYGASAKANNVSLATEIKTISSTSTAQEKLLADKISAFSTVQNGVVPTCADVAMTYNTTSNLCEKVTGTSGYMASQTLLGYTIVNSSTATSGTYIYGLEKNGNTFRMIAKGQNTFYSPYGFMQTNGVLSVDMRANGTDGPVNNGSNGIMWNANNAFGAVIYKSGNSITGSSIVTTGSIGLSKIDTSTFRVVVGGYVSGAVTQWSAFYDGIYACPSGGTLSGTICTVNTVETAPGVCQSGYTLISNQCVQN